MPKFEIQVLENGTWIPKTIDVRARNTALESETAYLHNISLEISQHYGHEGVTWTVARGTRSAQADFAALAAVSQFNHGTRVQDLLAVLNKPREPRRHFNKYERFSKHK